MARLLLAACRLREAAPEAAPEALDCWGDGEVFRYEACCGCGNDYGNYSGRSACWSGSFTHAACCDFYGHPSSVPSLPCWNDERGKRHRLELRLAGRTMAFRQRLPEGRSNHHHALAPHVLWPSAYALAAWLFAMPASSLVGRRTVELGCGLGLPSMAAALAGAKALATDVDRAALALVRQAAVRNLPPGARAHFHERVLDFTDEVAVRDAGQADVVLVAGQFYLETLHEPLLAAVRLLCASGCTLLMSNWVGMQQERIAWFLGGLDHDFEAQEIFDCSSRGYTHPHADYQCARFTRRHL